jgi:hypothetical protein
VVNIFVDIDGVLAWNNLSYLLSMFNHHFQLDIPEEQMARIETLNDFYALPQVQAYKAKVGYDCYHRQFSQLQWHPLYVLNCNVIEKATQGVRYLAHCSGVNHLGYCTVRVINFHEQWSAYLARVTQMWLRNNGFPNEERILFCDGVKRKLMHIAESIRTQRRQALLIDDSLELLLIAFHELSQEDQAILREHFTVAAFGYKDCPEEYPLSVIPFPDWGEVHNLAVEKEFKYAKKNDTPPEGPDDAPIAELV